MKVLATIVAAVALVSTSSNAFTIPVVTIRSSKSALLLSVTPPPTTSDNLSSRRSAILVGFTTMSVMATVTPTTALALVDANEDSAAMVRRIAANSEAANVAAKAKKLKEEQDAKNNADSGKNLVAAGLVGSVALSLPFFLPNLIRLGKKLGSGGENDGYGS